MAISYYEERYESAVQKLNDKLGPDVQVRASTDYNEPGRPCADDILEFTFKDGSKLFVTSCSCCDDLDIVESPDAEEE